MRSRRNAALPCSCDEFREVAAELIRKRELHGAVQKRLSSLLGRIQPNSAVVTEVSLVKGGRNDLVQFECAGRRAVFEIFVTPSQVPQDLRLLEQASADVKVAVLLDAFVNRKLSSEYFHKKPDSFPYIWVSDVGVGEREDYCIAFLRELTRYDSVMNRLQRLVTGPAGHSVLSALTPVVAGLESYVAGSRVAAGQTKRKLTGIEWLSLCIAGRVHQLGVPVESLMSLYQWLKGTVQHATMLVGAGFTVFLVTDMKGNHAILTDSDVADELILCGPVQDAGHVVVCLNKVINILVAAMGWPKADVRYHFYHTYREFIDKVEYKFAGLGVPPASGRAKRTPAADDGTGPTDRRNES